MSDGYKKIAFIKLCCPGDLLFTTPAVRAVRKKYPDARLYYITGKYSSFVPEHIPDIDEVITIRPPFELTGRIDMIREFKNGITAMRKRKFDLAINFHRSRGIGLMARLGGVKKICGFSSSRPFADIAVDFDHKIHEASRYLDLVRSLGCSDEGRGMIYVTLREDDDRARQLLYDSRVDGDYVVIALGGGENPGTIMHTKRWPTYRFKTVSEYIRREYDLSVISVGSKNEIQLAEEISPSVNLAGKTDLPALASLMKMSKLVIANDSGPLYLASAVGARTIGLYGPSSEELVAPMTSTHISVKNDVICRPCYLPQNVQRGKIYCPTGYWACMLALMPDKVCDAVDRLLAEK